MRLTASHIEFYRAKRQPDPAWFDQVEARRRPQIPSVHVLINQHVDSPRVKVDLGNAMCLLRSGREVDKRRPGYLDDLLYRMTLVGSPGNSKRRAGYARKWIKRLRKQRQINARQIQSLPS